MHDVRRGYPKIRKPKPQFSSFAIPGLWSTNLSPHHLYPFPQTRINQSIPQILSYSLSPDSDLPISTHSILIFFLDSDRSIQPPNFLLFAISGFWSTNLSPHHPYLFPQTLIDQSKPQSLLFAIPRRWSTNLSPHHLYLFLQTLIDQPKPQFFSFAILGLWFTNLSPHHPYLFPQALIDQSNPKILSYSLSPDSDRSIHPPKSLLFAISGFWSTKLSPHHLFLFPRPWSINPNLLAAPNGQCMRRADQREAWTYARC
mgnify:CR=1 FL=1